jgi:two-component system cell cycle sensor histidine kinase/response regulator CckA
MKTGTLEAVLNTKATSPMRLLLLENSLHDAELILLELKGAGLAFEHVLAEDQEQFRQALRQDHFDVVLSDYRLPGWTGLDALRELRAIDKDLPFLLVTGTLGEEAAVECIKQGVSDYVLRDHISRLPAALKRAIHEKNLRKRAEEALRLSELRNRDLVENSVYGIFRVAADSSFLDANPALLRILGCASFEQLSLLNLVRDVFRFPEQHAQLSASCRELGQVHGAEAEWRRRDGGVVAVRLNLRCLQIAGQLDCMEVIAEDVTELRAMERQLRQAQKFEAIGQLAGGIAHDFNNVVGAILGWAELGLEQNRANPQVAERFSRIREQGERAAALTRELLAFARRQVLRPRAVDLNTVVGGLASFLDKVISKDIELKVITAPLDPIKADPTQIEQVLMNLSINARDALAKGGRIVLETEMVELDESYCRFYPHVTPGRYAVLSVSDTGVGMDTDTRERIFEPFFTTKERGKGTGMGLATVYGIVKQHGGLIHVYSELGQGSLFRVYLPVMEGNMEDGFSGHAPVASTAEMRGTEMILLADDHESMREMARQTLVGLGYRVLSACNGEDALRLCETDTPAMAILDVVMPKLGGAATAAKLVERFANLQVLFTSGYSQDSDGVSAVIANSRYLQKPYSPTALGRMVREILDGGPKATAS